MRGGVGSRMQRSAMACAAPPPRASARRGQVAFEYIIIVGLVLLFLIPLWAYITSVKSQTSAQLSLTYAQTAADRLVSNADLVHSQGQPAKVTMRLYLPPGIQNVSFLNTTILLKVWVNDRLTDVAATSIAPLNGSLPAREGTYRVALESFGTYVNVSVV
ncbi:MAG: hypothetical protein HY520_01210 [Candidatus Aenigmarchaeota archaeon]|nr:hypothetical protein [Candidatus Aenigmarchaeota archaeon]